VVSEIHVLHHINSIVKLHQKPSTPTNGYCVPKGCPFYIESATSKRLSLQLLLALVHHTVAIHKADLAKLNVEYRQCFCLIDAHGCGAPCEH